MFTKPLSLNLQYLERFPDWAGLQLFFINSVLGTNLYAFDLLAKNETFYQPRRRFHRERFI